MEENYSLPDYMETARIFYFFPHEHKYSDSRKIHWNVAESK